MEIMHGYNFALKDETRRHGLSPVLLALYIVYELGQLRAEKNHCNFASKQMNYRQKKKQVTSECIRIGEVPFTSDEQASWAMSLTGVATAKSREIRASSRSNAILITLSEKQAASSPTRPILLPVLPVACGSL